MVLNGKVEGGIIKCQAKVGTKGFHISTLSAKVGTKDFIFLLFQQKWVQKDFIFPLFQLTPLLSCRSYLMVVVCRVILHLFRC